MEKKMDTRRRSKRERRHEMDHNGSAFCWFQNSFISRTDRLDTLDLFLDYFGTTTIITMLEMTKRGLHPSSCDTTEEQGCGRPGRPPPDRRRAAHRSLLVLPAGSSQVHASTQGE